MSNDNGMDGNRLIELTAHSSSRDFQEIDSISYMKVHAPWDVLTRYAELLKIQLPLQEVSSMMRSNYKYLINMAKVQCAAKLSKCFIRSDVSEKQSSSNLQFLTIFLSFHAAES